MTDLNALLIDTHRKNIARYRRLLRTKLTFDERRFLERRLLQETGALDQLQSKRSTQRSADIASADPLSSVIASRGLKRIVRAQRT